MASPCTGSSCATNQETQRPALAIAGALPKMSHSETYESFDKKFANSRTGSSKRVYKRNGEILAVPWYTPNSSYDKPASMRINSTMRASFRDPNMKATLTPYDPNALRNRLPVKFRDEAIPCVRFCKARGEHTYECAPPPDGGTARAGRSRARRAPAPVHTSDDMTDASLTPPALPVLLAAS